MTEALIWRKSSYTHSDNCVEVAFSTADVAVRDSGSRHARGVPVGRAEEVEPVLVVLAVAREEHHRHVVLRRLRAYQIEPVDDGALQFANIHSAPAVAQRSTR